MKVELNPQEMEAVAEFARQCGESVSDLLRKLAIREATLSDGYGADDPSYNFGVMIPVEGQYSSDQRFVEVGYNRIRRILGWREIKL